MYSKKQKVTKSIDQRKNAAYRTCDRKPYIKLMDRKSCNSYRKPIYLH